MAEINMQLRNFKDFLQLYNRLTEMCFGSCVDNLNSRKISNYEENCVNHCVNKFSNVNQKFLGTYVEIQQQINAKRQIEFEAQHEQQQLLQQKAQETAAAAAQLIDPISDPASPSEGLKDAA